MATHSATEYPALPTLLPQARKWATGQHCAPLRLVLPPASEKASLQAWDWDILRAQGPARDNLWE
jgi:hypothetical protein